MSSFHGHGAFGSLTHGGLGTSIYLEQTYSRRTTCEVSTTIAGTVCYTMGIKGLQQVQVASCYHTLDVVIVCKIRAICRGNTANKKVCVFLWCLPQSSPPALS